MTDHLIFLSIPGLRPRDVTPQTTPTLYQWANRGVLAELTPTFPCVTSPVQTTMWTGIPPDRHGVIANGFFHRDRREVAFWTAHHDVIEGEPVWDAIRTRRSRLTSAVWHAQNIKGASADFIVTPAPIHEPDGGVRLWCYSKPEGLYQNLLDALGHFPLQHYWGPLTGIESTRWILDGACWLIDRYAPNFHWIYIPHLDYAAQKFGPDSPQAQASLVELDEQLARLADHVARSPIDDSVVYVAAGEYALTDVTGVVYPNRMLHEAGLLTVREVDGREQIDLEKSAAFAMVDHQFSHIYLNNRADSRRRAQVCALFEQTAGIAGVYAGDDRKKIGLDHPRSGEIILVTQPDHWLAYYWWFDDAAAPAFARTVDIHRKPGYDPVELFFNPATREIPLNATLVKGSHGAPAVEARQQTALICSSPACDIRPGQPYQDVDLNRIALDLMSR